MSLFPALARRSPRLPYGRGPGRVRLSMYLTFAVFALAVLWQGWSTLRLENARAADARSQEGRLQRTFRSRSVAWPR